MLIGMLSRQKSGFTLIELLVVISIISGLAALILPNFMSVREKGRDTQRKADLRSLQQSLELYRQNQSPALYPTGLPSPGQCWSSNGAETTCTGSITYMKKVPGDPVLKNGSDPKSYQFTQVGSGAEYELCTCLENPADVAGVAGNCDDVNYVCDSGYKFSTEEP